MHFNRFPLGVILATPGALRTAEREGVDLAALIRRHATCDWAELDAHDRAANQRAVDKGGTRVFSVYSVCSTRFYIITEADRSATTVLLPEEY